ncbi:hypothetical protein, partial [Anaerotruncus colihominis]|uniref:hypothetical protein n=1 Tax=Anaerotruncus colihominis TaxID=169435 RepID=UPI00321A74D8
LFKTAGPCNVLWRRAALQSDSSRRRSTCRSTSAASRFSSAPANAVTCRHYAGLNRVFMPGSRDRFDNSSYDSPAKMDRQVISDIAG